MEKTKTPVKDLTPNSKQVNVLAKVISVGEAKEVMGKFGDSRRVAEAIVADSTAQIVLSLWNEQIGSIAKDETIYVDNAYVSLVRGHMRLNVGRYGQLSKTTDAIEPNTSVNMSDQEFQSERRSYGGGGGGGSYGGSGGGGGGSRDRGSSGGGYRRY